jgi:2,6-dihydroxypyridine 3-monooxygenase
MPRVIVMGGSLGGLTAALVLRDAGCDVPAALAAWERRQLLLGRQLLTRTREIGDASQFTGTFRPGDPRLIFGLHEPGH